MTMVEEQMVESSCAADRMPAEAPVPVDRVPPGVEVEDPRVVSVLPTDLLHDGEVIILLLKPSLWYIPLSCLRFLAGVGLAAGLAVLAMQYGLVYWNTRDVALLAIGAAGARLFWQFLEWLSRVYVLTDRRVIRVRGVLRVEVFECALKRIQHTEMRFSLRERFFALGTIMFATAGTGGVEASWVMLGQPLRVHQIVIKTLDRYR